ncbi:MAG: MFS transporter [Gordonia amarae]
MSTLDETPEAHTPAVDVTSESFKRKFMFRLVAVMVGGMILDGYILGIIGPVTSTIEDSLNINSLELGLIAAGPLFGIFIGAPICGWATDKWGRKPMFLMDMGLFVLASFLQFFIAIGQFFVDDWIQLFVIRLLMGVAIGGEYAIGWPLLSEFAPARLRGRLLGSTVLAWYFGFMIAFFIGTLMDNAGINWRIILGSSTVIAVILFIARLGLPESPRWLLQKGRIAEGQSIAKRYMNVVEAMEIELEAKHKEETGGKEGRFADLFNKENIRATVFASGFWFCASTPYFAIATFAVVVLEDFGFGEDSAFGAVGMTVAATLGVATTAALLDKLGRRALTIPPQWVTLVLILILAWWDGPGWLMLTMLLAFSFINSGVNTLTSVYPGEVFPTEVRGIGTGFASACSRIGAGLGTFLLPWSIDNLGMATSLTIAAIIILAGTLLSQALAPETKGKSLSETAATFSH